SGGWQTVASQSADSESRVTRETKAGSITWGVPAELKNETVIDVVHPFVEDNVRIVAQDRAGQVVPAHVSRGGGTSMVSAVRLQFPIRLSQVSMFHIQTRPYEWVEFCSAKDTKRAREAWRARSGGGPFLSTRIRSDIV
ncbi:MAG: hypothetical protein ACYS9T_10425, partial [Planctomycetota bacterium]